MQSSFIKVAQRAKLRLSQMCCDRGVTPPLADVENEVPKGRNAIMINPAANSAYLLITITRQSENDNRHFWCTITTGLLAKYAKGITAEWNTPEITSVLVAGYMRDFTKPGLSKIERLAKLRGAGKELFKVSPDHFILKMHSGS